MVYAVVLGVLLGLLTRGSIRGLANMRLRGEWLIILTVVTQVLLPTAIPSGPITDVILVWLLWLVPSAILTLALILNWRRLGLALAASGVLLNILVVGLNGGMPVLASAANQAGFSVVGIDKQIAVSWLHVAATPTTVLLCLGDVLPLPGPAGFRGLASLGDVLFAVGVMHTVFVEFHTPNQRS